MVGVGLGERLDKDLLLTCWEAAVEGVDACTELSNSPE